MDSPKNPFQPQDAPPEKLGKYVVERELGRGGMGVVYLCRDPDLDRPVAIKVLPESMQSDPERLRRFREEAKNVARLAHPNIVSIYGIERAETGALLYVMEYVEGDNLAKTLKAGRPQMLESLRICEQVARAIAAAHAEGIWHRDIKPGNIMLSRDLRVKVLDFGLAKRERGIASTGGSPDDDVTATFATNPGQIIGTPGYMSPEQIYGKGVDHRTDIFSFGAVLYVCLTGEHAFSGETTMHVITNTCHVDPAWDRLPAEVPQRLHELVQRCLAKEKQDRLNDINLAIAEIEEAIGEYAPVAAISGGGGDGGGGGGDGGDGGDYDSRCDSDGYIVVKDLSVRGYTRVQRVRKVVGDGSHGAANLTGRTLCRKITRPDPDVMGRERSAAMCRELVERARIQQKAAETDPEAWAPIHDFGGPATSAVDHDSGTGSPTSVTFRAFCITDEYPLSLASVAGYEPDHRQLHRIISEIVGALLALKHSLGREHGDLDPSNVLLTDASPAKAHIRLTDPAASAAETGSGSREPAAGAPGRRAPERRDLADLGSIIYQLVMQKKPPSRGVMRVPDSPQWQRLGRTGEQWRKLCEELLDPAYRGSLEEVQAKINDMAGGALGWEINSRLLKRLAVAATVVLLVATGAFIVPEMFSNESAMLSNSAENGIQNERVEPVGDLMEYRVLRDTLGIADVPGRVRLRTELERRGLASTVTTLDLFGFDRLEETPKDAEAVTTMFALRDKLLSWIDGHVQQLGDLSKTVAAAPLRNVRAAISATAPSTSEGRVDVVALIESLPGELEEITRRIAFAWAAFEETNGRLPIPEGDAVLGSFGDVARRHVHDAADFNELNAAVREWNRIAGALSDVEAGWEARIDYAHLRQTSPLYVNFDASKATLKTYSDWLDEISRPEFALLDRNEHDPRTGQLGELAQVDEAEQRHLTICNREVSPIRRSARQALESERVRIRDAAWTGRRADRDGLKAMVDEYNRRADELLAQLNADIRPCGEDCEERLTAVLDREVDWRDELLSRVWEDRRSALRDSPDPCPVTEELAIAERDILEHLNVDDWHIALPAGLDDESARRVEEVVLQRRQAALRNVLDPDAPLEPKQTRLEWDQRKQAFDSWSETVRSALSDALRVKSLLDAAYTLQEQDIEDWPQQHEDWPRVFDELEVPVIREIENRIEQLNNLPERREDLLTIIVDDVEHAAAHPERRRAAWLQMATVGVDDPQALVHELRAQEALETLYTTRLQHDRAEQLRDELERARPGRWEQHVRNVHGVDDRWLVDVIEYMDEFGVTSEQVKRLDERFQFSYRLFSLKNVLAKGDLDAVKQQATTMRDWLEDDRQTIDPQTSQGTSFLQELIDALARLEEVGEAPVMDPTTWEQVGPAAIGWIPIPGATNDYVIYCPPDWKCERGSAGEYDIEPRQDTTWPNSLPLVFRQVREDDGSGDGKASWLCTTEVTVGLAIDVHNNGGDWDAKGLGKLGRGPRAWDWSANGVVIRNAWLKDEQIEQERVTQIEVSRLIVNINSWRSGADGEWHDGAEGVTLQPTYIGERPQPTKHHPINQVSVTAVETIASTLGCRLPTVSDWNNTDESSQAPANLRDRTWEEHRARWETMRRIEVRNTAGRGPAREGVPLKDGSTLDRFDVYPANARDGAFQVGFTGDPPDEDRHHENDDGHLWFRPVSDESPQLAFRDLIGNVWEIVIADQRMEAGGDGNAIDVGDYCVIGGSALSHPDLPLKTPVKMFPRERGPVLERVKRERPFADVGFRLAFSANIGPNYERELRTLIEEQPYLLPAD